MTLLLRSDRRTLQFSANPAEMPRDGRDVPYGCGALADKTAIQGRYAMADRKVLVSGPVGAGKTTAIGTVSPSERLHTEARWQEASGTGKTLTTVALDHGTMQVANGDRAVLFGTPGQHRFDYMWEILAVGAEALVLLISNQRPKPLSDLVIFFRRFAELMPGTGVAVGVTGMDECSTTSLNDYRRTLDDLGASDQIPVMPVDARRPRDVTALVTAALWASAPLAVGGIGSQSELSAG